MEDLVAKYQSWTRTDLLDRLNLVEHELRKRNIVVDPNRRAEQPEAQQKEDGKPKKNPRPADKEIDPSRYSTRLIALKLAYLGKNYGGFEFQQSAELPTIEEELWKALTTARLIYPNGGDKSTIDFTCCEYSKCGRTDRGVSAFGQVISLRVRSNRPLPKAPAAADEDAEMGDDDAKATKEEKLFDDIHDELNYTTMLNKLLPPDIRIMAWCPVPRPDFSARFSCRERQYRYFFTQPSYLPLPSHYRPTGPNGRLDIEAMRAAARLYQGVHDFRNFCKLDPAKQISNFEREIFSADIIEVPDAQADLPFLGGESMRGEVQGWEIGAPRPKVYAFVVRGSAFLWHQIRCMVSILFLVGQGLEPPSLISEMLDVKKTPSRTAYLMAHEVPLVLWDCVYPANTDDPSSPRRDALKWVYPSKECEGDHYAVTSVLDSAWTTWRERKVDEVLAAQLLGRIAAADAPETWQGVEAPKPHPPGKPPKKKKKGRPVKPKVFEGGNNGKLIGDYVPVMKLKKMQAPEEMNDLYAKKMGFENAEIMRATEGWRKTVKDTRVKKRADREAEGK